jgi:hypothetical protein
MESSKSQVIAENQTIPRILLDRDETGRMAEMKKKAKSL